MGDSTDVFAIDDGAATDPAFISNFPVDMCLFKNKDITASNAIISRLTQGKYLLTDSTAAEAGGTAYQFDFMDGCITSSGGLSSSYIGYMWRRQKGFFDVVAYTGDSVSAQTIDHNLGAVPEMMWVKRRNAISAAGWITYHKDSLNSTTSSPLDAFILLNSDGTTNDFPSAWGSSLTDSTFTVAAADDINLTGGTYIAYLFATLAGISKVGSYTGNGTSQTINAGFTTGAKFIIVKRTDSTGDWFMWDSVRGIVAGNDPHLSLNTTAAEVTTDDSIDPDASGFIVNQNATTNINVSSAAYIYYCISEGV